MGRPGGGYSGSASTLTTGFLNNSGTITFKATVTDSRGRVSAEASVSITVTAYSPPYFNSSLSQRCLSNGTLDDDGTYIHALVSFGYSTCGGKNTLKTSVQYKQVSAEQWTDAEVTFASNTAFTYGRGHSAMRVMMKQRNTQTHRFKMTLKHGSMLFRGNEKMISIYDSLSPLLYLLTRYNHQQEVNNREINLEQHREIAQAVADGDSVKVQKLLYFHFDKHL